MWPRKPVKDYPPSWTSRLANCLRLRLILTMSRRADLSAAKAQRRLAEDAQRDAEEAQSTAEEKLKVVEEKLKEVELGLHAAQADLQKAKLKYCELWKKSKHYKSKAAHYKSKADRFHSQILAFTKVQDRTWVNGFSWGFDFLKEFVLNPPTPSQNFVGLNSTLWMFPSRLS
jgi:DNA-binding transcriptional MerR regulator